MTPFARRKRRRDDAGKTKGRVRARGGGGAAEDERGNRKRVGEREKQSRGSEKMRGEGVYSTSRDINTARQVAQKKTINYFYRMEEKQTGVEKREDT